MGISVENRRESFSGDGVTDEFSFSFRVLSPSDMLVILADSSGVETEISPPFYTLQLIAEGGIVTMATAPAVGETLVLSSETPLTQQNDVAVGQLPARTLNLMIDRLTIITQEIKEITRRSLKFSLGSSSLDKEFPEPEEDLYLRWDSSGDLQNSEIFGDSANISFDPSGSGLTSTNVQDAFVELELKSDNSGLATVATTGDYNDLSNLPTIPDVSEFETGSQIQTRVDAHANLTNNPHSVTALQVGLENVNNTSDANKPVSTAQRSAINSTWDFLATHWDAAPALNKAITGGEVFEYTYDGVTRFRFVPTAYDSTEDAFYESFNDVTDTLSGLIVSRGL